MTMTNVEAGTYEVRRSSKASYCECAVQLNNNNNFTHLQVVANYFGVNGTFQLLPAFNTEHFTLKGGDKDHPEKTDKSDTPCKCMLITCLTLMAIFLVQCLFSLISPRPHRWTRSVSFDWSHSRSCSGGCNPCSILLFQVKNYVVSFSGQWRVLL